ncbi:MAG: DUF4139 domain-containing protein [Desulfovibrio sp.]|jgi:uncharacterized protein (TIGR02231 family)|nr:DUF4139 domain-containing protein [Desulfovibrio sp.]
MKKTLLLALCAFPLCAGAAFAALRPPAQPASALFYPSQVQVTVEERLRPEALSGHGRGFLLVLPATADPSSFAVTLDNLPAGGFFWLDPEKDLRPRGSAAISPSRATRPEEESDPERRALLQTLVSLQDKADSLAAGLDTLDLRIRLWHGSDGEKETLKAEDRLKMDAAFKDLLPALFTARSAGERLREDNLRRLEEAENALRDYDRKHGRRLIFIPSDLPDGKTVPLRYTYTLPGSCRVSYDINALPDQEGLTIAQSASLVQSSGFAWKDLEVFISTAERDGNPDPRPLSPWRIRLEETPPPAPAPQQRPKRIIQMSNSRMSAELEEEKSVFRLLSLGRRSLDTDVEAVVPLAFNEYPARFHYTLRPSLDPRGFLGAALSLEKALELPAGRARLFVDSVFRGEKTISLNGREATLHFGSDPQVVVTRVDRKRASGEQGFLSKEQTILWHWDFIVRNARNRPVEAWIEDPIPDALDNAITVTVASSPEPEKEIPGPQPGGTKMYRWKLSLAPGEVRTIEHKVTLLAPSGKRLNPGREE